MHRGVRRVVFLVTLVLASSAVLGGPTLAAENGTASQTGGTNGTLPDATATHPEDPDQSRIDTGQYTSHDSIVVTQVYRLTPDRPGAVDIEWQFEIPDRVSDVRTRLPPGATDVRSAEFRETEDGIYEWSGNTATASITFTVRANESVSRTGPEAGGQYGFVDAGEWALIRRQPIASPGYRYPAGRDPGVVIRNRTAGDGVVGSGLVFLGPHRTYERTAHGQTFRLVVPEAATLVADRDEIFDSVADASDRLRVGDRDGTVTMIAAPTSVPWGVRGRQTGERDFYVLADERVDTPDNTWLHEYVHTRQDIERSEATRWFTEGSADYYAALLTLEQDRIGFDAFREQMDRGTIRRVADVRLVDPATWRSNNGDYLKGALVAGEIDRRIRAATGGEATLQDVFRRMNDAGSPVEQSEFLEYVRRAGGSSVVDPARRYTETTARPDTWSLSTHRETFGMLPASFRYRLPAPGGDGVRVRSVYRNGSLAEPSLVSGETLAVDVTVSNVGGKSGEYRLNVTVDGRPVATRTGQLDAGANATETVEHTFETPGTYRFGAGDEAIAVQVREPATPVVTDLSVDRSRVGPGESVTATATVGNLVDRPGERRLTIRQDGTEIASERVRLGPGQSSDVTATVTLSEVGDHRFVAGDQSVTVTVVETTSPTTDAGGTTDGGDTPATAAADAGASGPGFGAGIALAALLFVCGTLATRR